MLFAGCQLKWKHIEDIRYVKALICICSSYQPCDKSPLRQAATTHPYFPHNFVRQEFKKDLTEQLSLRVPQAAAVRCWLGCRDLKALWGVDPIWLTHLAGSRCWSSAETQLGCQSECLCMDFFSVTVSDCLFGTWLDYPR